MYDATNVGLNFKTPVTLNNNNKLCHVIPCGNAENVAHSEIENLRFPGKLKAASLFPLRSHVCMRYARDHLINAI